LIALQGRHLPFHPINAFSYISYYGDNVIAVATRSDAPWKTLKDLVEDGKKRPGAIKYGTAGVGTTQHLTTEALQFSTKAKFVHVPQQGSAASMPALLGKHVDFVTETSVWAPFVEDKQVRLLAVTTAKRSKLYPEVPTLNELGYRSLRSVQAIIGPAGMPEDIRLKLETAFRKALSDKTFTETMDRLAMEVIDLPGAEVKKVVEGEYELASELLTEIGKAK
jgi:tripartite-type tricarboxylate transporter receptor subunit TctC